MLLKICEGRHNSGAHPFSLNLSVSSCINPQTELNPISLKHKQEEPSGIILIVLKFICSSNNVFIKNPKCDLTLSKAGLSLARFLS